MIRNLFRWLGVIAGSLVWLFVVPLFAHPNYQHATLMAIASLLCFVITLKPSQTVRSILSGWRMALAVGCLQLLTIPILFYGGARFHDIPGAVLVLSWLADLGGLSTWVEGSVLYVQSSKGLLGVRGSWEVLGLLPSTWILLAGIMMFPDQEKRKRLRSLLSFMLALVCFVGIRFVILLHIARFDPDPLGFGEGNGTERVWIFQDPLAQALSFAPLSLLLAACWPKKPQVRSSPEKPRVHVPKLVVLSGCWALGGLLVTAGFFHRSSGEEKPGRVLIDDFHSPGWAPANAPFNTEIFGRKSIYNLSSFRSFLEKHYETRVNVSEPYSAESLTDVDVLILKTPTRRFESEEIAEIEDFVLNGGGLFLVGDHTDLLGTTTNLNQVAERFRLRFRRDAVNQLDGGQFASIERPYILAHPTMSRVDRLEFMTSCSLDVSATAELIVVAGNTFSDPMDLSSQSFFGNVTPELDETFGLHVFCAAERIGQGRVLAFADSTIFSNFAVMYGDRPEFLLGVVDYLNRKNGKGSSRTTPLILGFSLCLLGLGLRRAWSIELVSPVGHLSLVLGVALGMAWVQESQGRESFGRLPREPMTRVAFVDGGHCHYPPALVPSHVPVDQAFDTFFVWSQRLGLFPHQCSLEEALHSDVMILIHPVEDLSLANLVDLKRFVHKGGALLLMDSVSNIESTVNQFAIPFGMTVRQSFKSLPLKGLERLSGLREKREATVACSPDFPTSVSGDEWVIPWQVVDGGQPLYEVQGDVVAAKQSFGQGRVLVLAESLSLSRAVMGRQVETHSIESPEYGAFSRAFELFEDCLLGQDAGH